MTTIHGGLGGLADDPNDRPHPLALGHRLAEFELIEVIGEGGFGIVYRAYDHSLQREVAIKEYMPSMLARRVGDNSVHVRSARLTATFEAGLRSFINEARTLAQFSHPALVRVHRFWEQNSTAYMAIQLYKGRTLRRMAEQEPAKISEPWLRSMLGPLLGALESLHRGQCFHRDIAPDNIFIQEDGSPVLLDFGAARKSIADMVDEVAVMVKSGYSPIEQYADDNTLQQGPWTDLYALGAVLYRAVTGHPPPSAVVRSVQDAYVPLSSMIRSDLSPAFSAAVDHTLAVHSKDRTQSVAAFAAELGLVKLGDFYVSGMAAPVVAAPAVASAAPSYSPVSAPAPLEPTVLMPAVAPLPSTEVTQPLMKTRPDAPPPPPRVASGKSSRTKTAAVRPAKKGPPWLLIGGLVIALIAVGTWIGLRLTSGQQIASNGMAPVPPASSPMSTPSAPPVAMPPVAAASEAVNPVLPPPVTTEGGQPPVGGGTVVAGGATSPATPASATASNGLVPLDPAQSGTTPPVTPPLDTTAAELDDWNLAQTENTREGYEAYLKRWRRGPHVRDARNAIAEINRKDPNYIAGLQSGTTTGPNGTTPPTTAGGPATPSVPSMGRIAFNIRPWGMVVVDGVERGVSPPLKSLTLRPGIYTIEVRNGDLEPYRQRVTVQDGKSTPTVNHEFK